MRRRLAGALAGVALALTGCTRAPSGPLVLVVIDTLRADHVDCWGYPRPTSPHLCALADDGLRFTRAYTVRSQTTPAVASMLTGLYPHRHGLESLYQLLPEEMTTAAERLSAAGWATGGFVSSFVMVRDFSGLAQGFDIYEDDVRTREGRRENYERPAAETLERALTWLRQHGPHAFLFLHLIEPHGPYTPPPPYREHFAQAAGGPAPSEVPSYQRIDGFSTVAEYVGGYGGEIAAADAALGRLIAALRTAGWYDAATILVTSDHGESLGEEGRWFTHGYGVNDAEAHVPLVLKPARSAGAARGAVIAAPVSVVDVYPTLLAAAGLAAEAPGMIGRDLAATAATGERGGPPPLTELRERIGRTAAVHTPDCTVRWLLPSAPADGADWTAGARRVALAPPDASDDCVRAAAAAVASEVADRIDFQLTVPVHRRGDMLDHANRTRFIAARAPQGGTTPLSDAEREALHQLGYLE
jgi:arylsulfatase A-like enzyme